jgi:hypothetical protein
VSPVLAAGHGAHRAARRDHLLDDAHQHSHAQVLEAAGVAVAAEFDPEVGHAELPAQPLRPEEVGVALVHADDILVAQVGHDPLAHAPHAAAVGPARTADPFLEERLPIVRRAVAQRGHVVVHFEQTAAGGAGVDHVVDGILARTAAETAEVGVVRLGGWRCWNCWRHCFDLHHGSRPAWARKLAIKIISDHAACPYVGDQNRTQMTRIRADTRIQSL